MTSPVDASTDANDATPDDSQSPGAPAGAPPRRWIEPALIVAMILWWWFITGQSYFRNDDWLQFQHAAREGLGWQYLRLDVFSHFAPLNRLLHWAAWAVDPGNYTVGRLAMVGVLCLQLVALLWVFRAFDMNRGRRLFCLVLYGFGLGTMRLAFVTDALFHIVLATSVSTFSLGLFLLWDRHRRIGYLIGSWLTFGVAMLTQERPLLLIGFTGLAHLLLAEEVPWRRMPARLLRDLWMWIPYGLIAAVHLVYYLDQHYIPQPSPRTVDLLNYWWLLFTGLPTSWIGLWPGVPGGLAGELASLLARTLCFVAFLAVIRWTVRRNSWNWRPWLWWAVCGFVSVTLVGMGRLGLWAAAGPKRVAGDLQYSFDLVILLFFVVALLRPSEPGTSLGLWSWLTGDPGRRRWMRVLAAVCAISVPFGYTMMWRRYDSYRYAGRWMEEVASHLDRFEGREALPFDLVQARVPDNLMQGFWAPENRLDRVFDSRPDWPQPDGGSSDRRVFNTRGEPVPVSGRTLARVEADDPLEVRVEGATPDPGGGPGCLSVGPSTTVEWRLARAVRADAAVLDVAGTASVDMYPDVVVSGDRRLPAVPEPTGLFLRAGAAGGTHVMEVGRVETVRLERFAPGRLCLRSMALVMPIYPVGTDTGTARKQGAMGVLDQCRTVGLDGRPGAVTECGRPWPPGGPT